MTRRLQLLPSEGRSPSQRAAAAVGRVRESLLRDNRVIPPVLAVLALLIFAWLVAGAILSGRGQEGQEEQVSSQASLAQRPEDTTTDDGGGQRSGTPAPKVENRDADSYAGYDRPKDPFRDLFGKAGEKGKAGDSKAGEGKDKTGNDKSGDTKAKSSGDSKANAGDDKAKAGGDKTGAGDSKAGNSKAGTSKTTTGGEGTANRSPSSAPGSPDGSGQGGGGGGQGGSAGQGGGLFNSGGDLPAP